MCKLDGYVNALGPDLKPDVPREAVFTNGLSHLVVGVCDQLWPQRSSRPQRSQINCVVWPSVSYEYRSATKLYLTAAIFCMPLYYIVPGILLLSGSIQNRCRARFFGSPSKSIGIGGLLRVRSMNQNFVPVTFAMYMSLP